MLEDETVLIDDTFYLTGRRVRRWRIKNSSRERHFRRSLNLSIILVPSSSWIHEPRELSEAADSGVDLDLSGHTHDGQMFPANIVVHFLWENACGVLKKGSMTSVVTSGTGVWGPAMRVGTR